MTAAVQAADRLLREKEELAQMVTSALYARMPELLERFGEYGRGKCLEDMRYNLEHLAPAVHLEMPDMFARYVGWLDELLQARNVGRREILLSLETMDAVIASRFGGEADHVRPAIAAGVAVLRAREDL